MTLFLVKMVHLKGGVFIKKKVTVRLKTILVDTIQVIHKNENRSIQSIIEELLELGLIEYMKGDKVLE